MMNLVKKASILILMAVFLILGSTLSVSALPVTFTYTSDNSVNEWWYTEDGVMYNLGLGSNSGNTNGHDLGDSDYKQFYTNNVKGLWDDTDTGIIEMGYGHTYEIIWRVENSDYDTQHYRNPGGFLAEANGDFAIFDGGLLSAGNSYWELSLDNQNWGNVTEWGENKAGNGTKWIEVGGIDTSAQWIWTNMNMVEGQPGPGDDVYIRLTLTTPVPEPATSLLFGIGILSLAGIGRKRFSK